MLTMRAFLAFTDSVVFSAFVTSKRDFLDSHSYILSWVFWVLFVLAFTHIQVNIESKANAVAYKQNNKLDCPHRFVNIAVTTPQGKQTG
jgi:hypothetical protein